MSTQTKLPLNVFTISRLPRILFGSGELSQLTTEIAHFGSSVLIVTGGGSFTNSTHWQALQTELNTASIHWQLIRIPGEPSPEEIDSAVTQCKNSNIDVVVGIGGGSPLDAAKAIAALLPHGNSVMDHLEGVGRGIAYKGPSVPYIAVPTTAGTGSEMTKNAVLSNISLGFKKSFRDEQLTAQVAIVDSALLETCPRPQLIANAMDSFTQLLESYTSPRSNPITDALVLSGLEHFLQGFSVDSEADLAGLDHLAYASMISGICLAQTGLGAVHGIASPLGANFNIPHGVACGTMLAAVTATNIGALQQRQANSEALVRYATVGRLMNPKKATNPSIALDILVKTLWQWTDKLGLEKLSHFGMVEADISIIVAASGGNSMKTNPLVLTDNELEKVLLARL